MMLDAYLGVECQMTNPPRPVGFGVFLKEAPYPRRAIAILTVEEVRRALARFDDLIAARQRPFNFLDASG